MTETMMIIIVAGVVIMAFGILCLISIFRAQKETQRFAKRMGAVEKDLSDITELVSKSASSSQKAEESILQHLQKQAELQVDNRTVKKPEPAAPVEAPAPAGSEAAQKPVAEAKPAEAPKPAETPAVQPAAPKPAATPAVQPAAPKPAAAPAAQTAAAPVAVTPLEAAVADGPENYEDIDAVLGELNWTDPQAAPAAKPVAAPAVKSAVTPAAAPAPAPAPAAPVQAPAAPAPVPQAKPEIKLEDDFDFDEIDINDLIGDLEDVLPELRGEPESEIIKPQIQHVDYDIGRSGKKYTASELETLIRE